MRKLEGICGLSCARLQHLPDLGLLPGRSLARSLFQTQKGRFLQRGQHHAGRGPTSRTQVGAAHRFSTAAFAAFVRSWRVRREPGLSGPAWREPHHLHITGEFMNYAATTARPEEPAATCKR